MTACGEVPVFTQADLGGTVDCDFTGWLSVDVEEDGCTGRWGVTLIAGLRHDTSTALWGVATWETMQQPVCCFTAPTDSTPTQLRAAARHAFTGPAAPGLSLGTARTRGRLS